MTSIQMTSVSSSSEGDSKGLRLISAASAGQLSEVSRLIHQGVAAHYADHDNRTPLHLAATGNSLDIVKLLVSSLLTRPNGVALINHKDRYNMTALDCATQEGHRDVCAHLRENGGQSGNLAAFKSKFLEACHARDLTKVQFLVDSGISPNFSDYDQRTPLHLAVSNHDAPMVKYLIDQKAAVDAEDRFGNTPLLDAMRFTSRTGTDPVQEIFLSQFPDQANKQEHGVHNKPFMSVFLPIQVIMIIIFAATSSYGIHDEVTHDGERFADFNYLADTYSWFMDVHVMIFIGFGFLMTFLRKYSFGAVGLTFLIGAYVIQLHILVDGLIHYALGKGHVMEMNIKQLILGDFAAGAVLISYGALLGKVTATQMLVIATFECIFFTLNETIGLEMGITDIGGSMVIHMFGAFFGLSCSYFMQDQWKGYPLGACASVYHSDMFAMIGSVFLWMFWPSFNAVLGGSDELRHLAIVNTVLSLAGSCVAAFLASYYFRKEFNMVDIQNATLAGGVAMGTSADLYGNPGVSILIGAFGGVLSVFGYVYVQNHLETRLGIHDTCGVHNLHGMPSIVGALAGIIILAANKTGNDHVTSTPENQLGFLLITLLMSIVTGGVTATIAKMAQGQSAASLFSDEQDWEVPHEETPYYFDKHGESQLDTANDESNQREQQLSVLSSKVAELEATYRQKLSVINARLALRDDASPSNLDEKAIESSIRMLSDVLARRS
jgi:ammonium transporter Rh